MASKSVKTSTNNEVILVQIPSIIKEGVLLDSGCQTPPEYIFDSFAPTHDKFCVAPKTIKASRTLELGIEFEELEQEEIRTICRAFLDRIISEVSEICEGEEGDGFRTPTEMPLLTDIANTCLGTPIRPSLKIPIDIKKKVVPRKLNFDLDLE